MTEKKPKKIQHSKKLSSPQSKSHATTATEAEVVALEGAEVTAPRKMLHLRPKTFGIILMVTGFIGLLASIELTLDKINVLKDPNFSPVCNFNPIFSCQSVMLSNQAEVAGIPNTLFGLIGFAMVIAIGAAIIAGGRLSKRFWQLWMLGMAGGFVMMLYLIFQSIYRLGTLCVFCMTTWAILLPLIWYSLLWALQHQYISVPKRWEKATHIMRREHVGVLLLIYAVIVFLIVNHFWYYFKTL